MKTIISKFLVLMAILITNACLSQTKSENDDKLTAVHNKAKKNINKITNDTAKTKEEQIELANEAAKNIEAASKILHTILLSTPEESGNVVKPYHENINKLYAVTTNRITALQKELKSPIPNEAILKEHVYQINEMLDTVEKKHQYLKRITRDQQ